MERDVNSKSDTKQKAERLIDEMGGGMSEAEFREKLAKIVPLLSGNEGKKLMQMLMMSGNNPARLRNAMEAAANGNGNEAKKIISDIASTSEGEMLLARLMTILGK